MEAIMRMRRALDEFVIEAIQTVIPFHKVMMRDEEFIAGHLHTELITERNILDKVKTQVDADNAWRKSKENVLAKLAAKPAEAPAPAGAPVTDKKTVALAAAIASYINSKPQRQPVSSGWVISGRVKSAR